MDPLLDTRILRASETALALKLLTEMDLLRLKTLARLHARGLPPDVGWDDLLQEAITRVLSGARRRPRRVAIVAFLAGIMRSLKSEHWRRAAGSSARIAGLRAGSAKQGSREAALPDPAPDPERALIAAEELQGIETLFGGDAVVLRIIAGLGEGLTAEQIRLAMGLSTTDYDSARKRMRRCLLREGLTCEPK